MKKSKKNNPKKSVELVARYPLGERKQSLFKEADKPDLKRQKKKAKTYFLPNTKARINFPHRTFLNSGAVNPGGCMLMSGDTTTIIISKLDLFETQFNGSCTKRLDNETLYDFLRDISNSIEDLAVVYIAFQTAEAELKHHLPLSESCFNLLYEHLEGLRSVMESLRMQFSSDNEYQYSDEELCKAVCKTIESLKTTVCNADGIFERLCKLVKIYKT